MIYPEITMADRTYQVCALTMFAQSQNVILVGLYREYAIAIQDDVGDSNGGQCVVRHNANYIQHSQIYA